MEANSKRRQKFNINSTGTILDKWNSDPEILKFLSLVKQHVIDINIPNGKIYHYDVGGRNLLSNVGPIYDDQWPHYDYANPNNNKKSYAYLKSMLVTNGLDKIIFVWCQLCLHDLIHEPLNSLKGIAIVAEKPYGKLMLNSTRPAVHRQYFGRDTSKGRITYGIGSGSNTIGSGALTCVTRPFNYYLHKLASFLHKTLYYGRTEFCLNGSDLSEEFNHCTVLLYYAQNQLKKNQQ